jgi:hypothetical protein
MFANNAGAYLLVALLEVRLLASPANIGGWKGLSGENTLALVNYRFEQLYSFVPTGLNARPSATRSARKCRNLLSDKSYKTFLLVADE